MRAVEVDLSKERMKFSAGHFTISSGVASRPSLINGANIR